jgi:ketosteroid isomerase-like protein
MRSTRFVATFATLFALSACGGEEPAPQAPPPPPPPAPTASAAPTAEAPPAPAPKPSLADLIPQTLKGIGDAFNAHDAKKIASYHTEDCVVLDYGGPGGHSRDDVEKSIQGLFDTFSDAKSSVLRVWIKGNVAIQELAWTGTMTSDFMGVKATKKPVGGLRVHVAWFNDDGLVKELHEYGDAAGMMAQMKGKAGAPPVPTLSTNAPEIHVAKSSPDEDKLVDWLKTVDDAFNTDDVKAAVATHADDADALLSFSGKPAVKGKKDLTKTLTDFFKTFPDQKWTSSNVWGIDGFTVSEKTLTGTQKGKLGPIPASNKPVTWHWLEILQPNADGKVQHAWLYANVVEVMMQTGALKAPGEMGAPKAAAPKAAAPKAAPAPKGAAPSAPPAN